MAEVLEVYHPLPLDGKSPPPNSRASASPDFAFRVKEPEKGLLALKSTEQIELASHPVCQGLFCCDGKALCRRKGEEGRNQTE